MKHEYAQFFRQTHKGTFLEVKIKAQARKNKVEISPKGIKVYVSATPEKGKANQAVIDLLSRTFKVKKKWIVLLKGHTSSKKIFFFEGITKEQILSQIN